MQWTLIYVKSSFSVHNVFVIQLLIAVCQIFLYIYYISRKGPTANGVCPLFFNVVGDSKGIKPVQQSLEAFPLDLA